MNIDSRGFYPANSLSNFAPHPFVIDDIECASMEGFLQSLKFKDPNIQIEICKLVGRKAKYKGYHKNWWTDQTLYWRGNPIKRDSEEYQELLTRAYDALFENESFRRALKQPMKNSEFLELNLKDESHSLFGRCRANNSENYFYFSMCDYDVIKDCCWYENITKPSNYHRLVTMVNNKPITMHGLLGMNNPDHINRNPLDNRRENLDNNASKGIQSQNRGLQINNTSGCKGVHWIKKDKRWIVQIKKDKKVIYLGQYKSKNDAIIARLNAEKIYFDKRSWQIELMKRFDV